MTQLLNVPADFADEALAGFVAANSQYVRKVHGGVVRSTIDPPGEVAIVVGGGTGHYPAFAGWVGPGLAHGAPCGNIFSSPSSSQIYSVAKAADNGGGVLLGFGNYAGDVLHFGAAAAQLASEGIEVQLLAVTDDIASSTTRAQRRGIAGDLPVFKIAGAAAASGSSLDEVLRIAQKANDATDSLGVAFSGCTLPGAERPLFAVPEGKMALGLGIHGEPGISEHDMGTAAEIAELLVENLIKDRPEAPSSSVTVLLNGLGTVKYEELFVVYGCVHRRLSDAGFTIIQPIVGEQVTSLDMAGLSLTITYLDDELEQLWTAPAAAPAFHVGTSTARAQREEDPEQQQDKALPPGTPESQAVASRVLRSLLIAEKVLLENEELLGNIDAVAGDGDHGIGMSRGVVAAVQAATAAQHHNVGARTLLGVAADAWSERAGGTSGALWGASLNAVSLVLGNTNSPMADTPVAAVNAFVTTLQQMGGAKVGDKTMVDAVVPFAQVLQRELESGKPLVQAWHEAAQAATDAAANTATIPAALGRARTHGDKSLGTPDAGATSFGLIVRGINENWTDIMGEPT